MVAAYGNLGRYQVPQTARPREPHFRVDYYVCIQQMASIEGIVCTLNPVFLLDRGCDALCKKGGGTADNRLDNAKWSALSLAWIISSS